MNICCDTYTESGCLNSCDALNFGISTFDGDFTLLLSSGYEATLPFRIGDVIEFNVPLNEDYNYSARLTYPNASFICYKFKTYYAPAL